MKAEEFDKIFDDNEEDIIEYLDLSTIRRPMYWLSSSVKQKNKLNYAKTKL